MLELDRSQTLQAVLRERLPAGRVPRRGVGPRRRAGRYFGTTGLKSHCQGRGGQAGGRRRYRGHDSPRSEIMPLARTWNAEPSVTPSCAPHSTAMFMFNPGNGTFEADAGYQDGSMRRFRSMGQGDLAAFAKGAAGIFFIPDPPGDPEGSHPERDARHFGEVASAFKRHGIDLESIARKVSSRGTTTTCSCCGHKRE